MSVVCSVSFVLSFSRPLFCVDVSACRWYVVHSFVSHVLFRALCIPFVRYVFSYVLMSLCLHFALCSLSLCIPFVPSFVRLFCRSFFVYVVRCVCLSFLCIYLFRCVFMYGVISSCVYFVGSFLLH